MRGDKARAEEAPDEISTVLFGPSDGSLSVGRGTAAKGAIEVEGSYIAMPMVQQPLSSGRDERLARGEIASELHTFLHTLNT